MKNIKQFCKDHKRKIVFASLLGATIGLVAKGKFDARFLDKAGKNVISWKPNGNFMNLERVKEVLDLNAGNNSIFAIVKEGLDPNAYTCILLSKDVVTELI